ncbi:hypothetical protein [Nocardiopsis synnemataformans]|uniref:hypothetical protein n=1 Tax=Nocardiopsis synnemataformans TaxID=61305 RepID=UPI003EBE5077
MTHAAPTPAPGTRAETRRDALLRGLRTLGQTTISGTAAVVLLVVATGMVDTLSTGEAVTIGALVQGVGAPLLAYLLRRWEGRQPRTT